MPKLIIGLVGQAGCGKGTAADLLREKYGAGYIRFSGILGQVLETLGIDKSRENFTKLSNGLRDAYGEDALSYAVEKIALAAPEDIVVIDGIRRPEDIVALEPLPHFKLLSIEVPAEIRFERMKKRGEKSSESQMTWEQFQKEENFATEITIPLVMTRAWKAIPNAGSREEFETAVHAAMHELGFGPNK